MMWWLWSDNISLCNEYNLLTFWMLLYHFVLLIKICFIMKSNFRQIIRLWKRSKTDILICRFLVYDNIIKMPLLLINIKKAMLRIKWKNISMILWDIQKYLYGYSNLMWIRFHCSCLKCINLCDIMYIKIFEKADNYEILFCKINCKYHDIKI